MTNSNPGQQENILNTGPYSRTMNSRSFIHPNSTCVGSAGGAGKTCSNYGATRRLMKNIGDPVLMQRSYHSSAHAPSTIDKPEDTLNTPVHYPATNVNMNKGSDMTSFHTRDFHDTSQIVEHDYSNYHMFPKTWPSNQFYGVNVVGGFQPSREQSRKNVNKQYQIRSRGSYGSYGK
jgi:hypothetical protein